MKSTLSDYSTAFHDVAEPFLTYHAVNADKSLSRTELSRGDFWLAARRAAARLRAAGVGEGDAVLHFFSSNTVGDVVYRLAAVMVRCVPATVNWQADTPERVLHKA